MAPEQGPEVRQLSDGGKIGPGRKKGSCRPLYPRALQVEIRYCSLPSNVMGTSMSKESKFVTEFKVALKEKGVRVKKGRIRKMSTRS